MPDTHWEYEGLPAEKLALGYRWEDEQRKTLLVLRGTYLSEEGTPARKDPYYYPFAGELAWTRRLMEDVPDRFSRDGYLDFLLNRQDSVRISHDGIEVRVGSQTDRIEVDALKDIALKGGRFSFTAQDAKWYSNSGRIRFQYAKMANAKLFSVVLKSLWGVTTE